MRGDKILDVGCGWGRWGCLFRTNYFEWGISNFPQVWGIDGNEAYCKACNDLGVYVLVRQVLVPCDLPTKAFDTVFASEIFEHLPDSQVEVFIDSLINAARKRVIITTPAFPCLREGSHSPLDYNESDHHLSHTTQAESIKKGFTVRGAGFHGGLSIKGRLILKCLRVFGRDYSQWCPVNGLSYYLPSLAHTSVAYYDITPST
jgi:hypothetical protein